MELEDDVAAKHRAPTLDTARQSKSVIDEVDHVPAFEDLCVIRGTQQACQGFELANLLLTCQKALPTGLKAPRQSHREVLACLVRARRNQALLAKVDPHKGSDQ